MMYLLKRKKELEDMIKEYHFKRVKEIAKDRDGKNTIKTVDDVIIEVDNWEFDDDMDLAYLMAKIAMIEEIRLELMKGTVL